MEIQYVPGLDMPNKWHRVYAVTTASGAVHHHYVHIQRMDDDPDPEKAGLQITVKVGVWCCDENGEAILDSANTKLGLVHKTTGIPKDRMGTDDSFAWQVISDLIYEQVTRSRANANVYESLFSDMEVASS